MSHKSRYAKKQEREGKPTAATQVKLAIGDQLSIESKGSASPYLVPELEKLAVRLHSRTLKKREIESCSTRPTDGTLFLGWADVIRDNSNVSAQEAAFHTISRYILGLAPLTATRAEAIMRGEASLELTQAEYAGYLNSHMGNVKKDSPTISLRSCWTEAHSAFARLIAPREGPRSDAFFNWKQEDVFSSLHQLLKSMDYPLFDLAERDQKRGPCDYPGWKKLREQVLAQDHYAPITMRGSSVNAACRFLVDYIIQLNGGEKLKPLSVKQSMYRILENGCGENGLGYPFFKSGRNITDGRCFDTIQWWAEKIAALEMHPYLPLQVGTRVQSGREVDGVYSASERLILADSKGVQVAMGRFVFPKQDLHQKADPARLALASPKRIQEERELIDHLIESDFGYSIDYKRFDRTIGAVIDVWYRKHAWKIWDGDHKATFEWAAENHRYAPVVMEDGFLWFKNGHGLCSGKIDTNDLGSDVNRIATYASIIDICHDIIGRELNDDEVKFVLSHFFVTVQGDDNFTCCVGWSELKDWLTASGGKEVTPDYFSLHAISDKVKTLGGLNVSTDTDKVLPYTMADETVAVSFLSKYTVYNRKTGEEWNHQHSFTRCLNSIINPETLCQEELWLQDAKVKNENVHECDSRYGERVKLRVGWLNCPKVTSPIVLKWWASLSNIAYNKREFMVPVLDWITTCVDHHFNPALLTKPERAHRILYAYGSHIDDQEIRDGIDTAPFFIDTARAYAKWLGNNLEGEFLKTYDFTIDEVLTLADWKPDSPTKPDIQAIDEFVAELDDAFTGKDRLINSVMLNLPTNSSFNVKSGSGDLDIISIHSRARIDV